MDGANAILLTAHGHGSCATRQPALKGASRVKPKQFFKDFQDRPAPRLDTYEQTVYLYLFGTPYGTTLELTGALSGGQA